MANNKLEQIVVSLYKNNLLTLSRLKAIEAILASKLPKAQQKAWNNALNKQADAIFNDILAHEADRDAAWAAKLVACGID